MPSPIPPPQGARLGLGIPLQQCPAALLIQPLPDVRFGPVVLAVGQVLENLVRCLGTGFSCVKAT